MAIPVLETRISKERPGDFEFSIGIPLREGEALFVKHPERGWEFPGGKVEEGESREEALVRELREEIGCMPQRLEPVAGMRDVYDDGVMHGTAYVCRVCGRAEARDGMEAITWSGEPPEDLSFPRQLYLDLMELALSAFEG